MEVDENIEIKDNLIENNQEKNLEINENLIKNQENIEIKNEELIEKKKKKKKLSIIRYFELIYSNHAFRYLWLSSLISFLGNWLTIVNF
jgi:hypothetical protein